MARLAAYLILAGFLLGNLIRIPVLRPEITVTVLDIAVLAIYFLASLKCQKTSVHPSILLFISWLLITLIIGSSDDWITGSLTGFAYFVRYLFYFFSFYPLSRIFTFSQRRLLVEALAIMFPLVGVVQYFWYPDLRPFTVYGWDEHYLRVFGTILDPNFFGLVLIWSLLNIRNLYYWIIGFLALCFTYSRSSFLSFIASFGLMHLKIDKLLRYLGFGILVILSFLLLPRLEGEGVRLERKASVAARAANIKYAWKVISKHPVTGVGFNQLKTRYAGIDNSFLFVTAASGLVGLGLYANFLLHLYSKIRSNSKLAAFFVAVIVHSFFNNTQFFTPIVLLFSLLMAAEIL